MFQILIFVLIYSFVEFLIFSFLKTFLNLALLFLFSFLVPSIDFSSSSLSFSFVPLPLPSRAVFLFLEFFLVFFAPWKSLKEEGCLLIGKKRKIFCFLDFIAGL